MSVHLIDQHDWQTVGSPRWSDEGCLIAERLRPTIADHVAWQQRAGIEPGQHRAPDPEGHEVEDIAVLCYCTDGSCVAPTGSVSVVALALAQLNAEVTR